MSHLRRGCDSNPCTCFDSALLRSAPALRTDGPGSRSAISAPGRMNPSVVAIRTLCTTQPYAIAVPTTRMFFELREVVLPDRGRDARARDRLAGVLQQGCSSANSRGVRRISFPARVNPVRGGVEGEIFAGEERARLAAGTARSHGTLRTLRARHGRDGLGDRPSCHA
jgi:hypothetical protein